MRLILILLLAISLKAGAQNHLPAVGMWREHAPYGGAIDVTASENKIYAATTFNLFSIDRSTKEIERFSKVSGLSETGISRIAFEPFSKKLVIAYSNSNIDVMDRNGIQNVPGLKRAIISGDKNIYNIYTENQTAYLSTGLGVLVLDLSRLEIRSSWYIGTGGNYVRTNGFTRTGNQFYAATEEGVKTINTNNPNPANFNNWTTLSGSNGLPAGAAQGIVTLENKTIVLAGNILYINDNGSWQPFYSSSWEVTGLNVSESRLMVSERQQNGEARVTVLKTDGTTERILAQPGIISFPKNTLRLNNEYWVADLFGGLSHWQGNSFESYRPDSPQNIAMGEMIFGNNIFYATAGSVNEAWNYTYNRSGVFRFENGQWSHINQYSFPQLDSMMDFITIAIDPRDGSAWAGSYGGGLLHIPVNGPLKIYKQQSPLEGAVGDPLGYRVSGLAFDSHNNLWVANYGSTRQLHVLKDGGGWQSFSVPFFINEGAVAQVLVDDADQVWIVSPKNNGLLVLNHRNTLDNPNDDLWRIYRMGAGAGNLPSNEVTHIAKDKSGFLWVGTSDGIAVIQCPGEAFSTGCEAIKPTIREGGFVNFLFKGEYIRNIAVDGADRKWISTAGGVWLVNAEGNKVLAHFNETNSPLPSNDVKGIAINGNNGEVFFGTAKGIVSYRGMATEAEAERGNVLAFPNPVPPGFSGTIAIRGLPENSVFKIIETSGRLVFQGRSLGGQANWNGHDYRGRKAAPGIYIVMAVDDQHQEKAVSKIVIAGK